MRFFKWLLVVVFCGFFASCFDITEAVVLNKKGDGHYSISFDMSKMYSDPMMAGMMKSAGEQEGVPLGKIDTTIFFKDMPDSMVSENSKALEKLTIKVKSDEAQKLFVMTMDYPFDNVEDLNSMLVALEASASKGKDNAALGALGAGGGFMSKGVRFAGAKRSFERMTVVSDDIAPADDNAAMMKMLMGSASYKLVYTMPGKIKSSTIPGAAINGNTLTVSASMLDISDKKLNLSGVVKYK